MAKIGEKWGKSGIIFYHRRIERLWSYGPEYWSATNIVYIMTPIGNNCKYGKRGTLEITYWFGWLFELFWGIIKKVNYGQEGAIYYSEYMMQRVYLRS